VLVVKFVFYGGDDSREMPRDVQMKKITNNRSRILLIPPI
jgi:hypothetical protein